MIQIILFCTLIGTEVSFRYVSYSYNSFEDASRTHFDQVFDKGVTIKYIITVNGSDPLLC